MRIYWASETRRKRWPSPSKDQGSPCSTGSRQASVIPIEETRSNKTRRRSLVRELDGGVAEPL